MTKVVGATGAAGTAAAVRKSGVPESSDDEVCWKITASKDGDEPFGLQRLFQGIEDESVKNAGCRTQEQLEEGNETNRIEVGGVGPEQTPELPSTGTPEPSEAFYL